MKKELIEIKIDKSSLPKDGQKVRWQTQKDYNKEVWKEGIFSAGNGDDLFCVGFEDKVEKWDMAFDVLHWQLL